MKPWLGKLLGFTAVLGILALVVNSGSRWLDFAIVCGAWGAFLVASIVAMVKGARSRRPTMVVTQISALPRSWQRWILGERGDSKRP